MSVAIWARKTVALGLAAMLFGPSVSLLSAQEGQNQDEKRARRKQQEEGQQRKQAEREQQQSERRAQREAQSQRQQERAQQDQQGRQREREERVQRQQERQQDDQRARQAQRADQEQRARQAQEQRARQSDEQRSRQQDQARQNEQWQRERVDRQQAEEVQRTRQRRNDDGRAQAEAQARAAESSRQAQEQSQRVQEERDRARRSDDARYRQPQPGRDGRDDYRYGNDRRNGRVITERDRSVVVRENRDRSERWNSGWNERERRGNRYSYEVQRQRRNSYYRYQQRYLERQRRWHLSFDWNDYASDPYYWSAPSYRYRYQGRYYDINDYGRDMLSEAVNRGYEEGFNAGQADRDDRWRGDYRDSYVYEDASYGYRGMYVDEEQYAYYFRQGFDRGYADGHNGRFEYGRRDNTGLKIAAGVLAGILVFEALR